VDGNVMLVGILSLGDVLSSMREARWVDTPLLRKLLVASRMETRPRSWRQGSTASPN